MKMRIKDIIELVDMRNKNLLSDKPMGINIDKYFMPSVANTIGVDLKTYKLVPHNCFACNLMHVGRDERVPMAINKKEDPVLVSPAYLVFRVKESVDVLPDFLMLWFRRPTFDRNAWFFTAGDVRGGLDKKDFFNMEVHVPDITTQRRIVAEYQAVEKRIDSNKVLIASLHDTAWAVYKEMFISSINLSDLPQGWYYGTLADFGDIISGATPSTEVPEYWQEDGIVWLSPADLSREGTLFMRRGAKSISDKGYKSASTRLLPKGTVLFSSRAPIGLMSIAAVDLCTNQGFKSIVPRKEIGTEYTYYVLASLRDRIANENTGATFAEVSGSSLKLYEAIIPTEDATRRFSELVAPIHRYIDSIECENKVLKDMLGLLLSKLSE